MRSLTYNNRQAIGRNILGTMGDTGDGGGGSYDAYDPNNYTVEGGDGGYGFDYYDAATGIYYDAYGNQYDVVGSGIFGGAGDSYGIGADGVPVLRIQTDETGTPYGNVDLSALGQTIDWWNQINADPSIDITLPAITASIPLILQIPDSGVVPPGLNLPPVLNALPPKKLAAIKKALQNIAQNGKSSGTSSSAGSKPQAVKPSAGGQCPAGYTMSAGGYCLLNPTNTQTNQTLAGVLSNPIYLIGGAILLVLLAKK